MGKLWETMISGWYNVALPKVESPTFWRENPRWIRKCKKFFKMHFTPVNKWVEITSLYLEGKTEIWYEEFFLRGNDLAIWEEFARAICMRLGSGKDDKNLTS
jgi:hypothetical protein